MENSKSKIILLIVFTSSLLLSYCSSSQTPDPIPNPNPTPTYNFAKGADVGWLSQMEATGYRFYDTDGTEKNCLQLLKDRGMNTTINCY